MSRCYPYHGPPNANKGEALDELIKLRKDKDETKLKRIKLRKECSRSTETEKCDKTVKKNDFQEKKKKKRKNDFNGGHLSKAVVEESDQVDSSDLTQEDEQPTISNNKKRRLHEVEPLSNDGDKERRKIRIRIPNIGFGKHSFKPCRELPLAIPESRNETKRCGLALKQCQELPLATQVSSKESKRHEAQKLFPKQGRELPLAMQESNKFESNEPRKLCLKLSPELLKQRQELPLAPQVSSKESKRHEAQKLFLNQARELPLAMQESNKFESNEARKLCLKLSPELLKQRQELPLAPQVSSREIKRDEARKLPLKTSRGLPLAVQESNKSKRNEAQKLFLKPSRELPLAPQASSREIKTGEAQKLCLKTSRELPLAIQESNKSKRNEAQKLCLKPSQELLKQHQELPLAPHANNRESKRCEAQKLCFKPARELPLAIQKSNKSKSDEAQKLCLKPAQELSLAVQESNKSKSDEAQKLCLKQSQELLKQRQGLPLAPHASNKESKRCEAQKLCLKPVRELPLAIQENNKSKSNEAQKLDLEQQERRESKRVSKTSLCVDDDSIQRPDYLYRKLIEHWVLPKIDREHNDFEDEWLIGPKQENRQESRIHEVANVVSCSMSSSLWPKAHYLPEADMFALPYTVPF
ncbi:uncharacterized protein LOC133811669 [Humulus lupulus]|uniref:uncharacterized protein LOC133781550 n=1 Tax=Humulus lupulus TaxID=3486 RepID=UPI002B40FEA0|nr:uncharacterized protein LOC133781550 [Humulus lupulus]XP_062101987.1 uncharacterized protein LOC133810174 [Humulus lupulus]XP_062102187.1 uncharacterized protein LOC133811666 [Humulus lupulus]XP_062102190.1 uncharacterized protein LOC133811669 [Humulus lupulus]